MGGKGRFGGFKGVKETKNFGIKALTFSAIHTLKVSINIRLTKKRMSVNKAKSTFVAIGQYGLRMTAFRSGCVKTHFFRFAACIHLDT